jgi:phosphopentomutase
METQGRFQATTLLGKVTDFAIKSGSSPRIKKKKKKKKKRNTTVRLLNANSDKSLICVNFLIFGQACGEKVLTRVVL